MFRSLTYDGVDFPDRGRTQHSFGYEAVGYDTGYHRRDPLGEERERRQETVLRKNHRASFVARVIIIIRHLHDVVLTLTSVIEKCNTSLMYLGRSVMIVKPPQSCPASTMISAHTGHDVKMDFQGVGGKS